MGLGRSPQRGSRESPWSGDQGAKPPEAESILALGRPTDTANLHKKRFWHRSAEGNSVSNIEILCQISMGDMLIIATFKNITKPTL